MFPEDQKGNIGSICINKIYTLYLWFNSLHGQFSGLCFLTSLLKALIVLIFPFQEEPFSRFKEKGMKYFLYHE